MALTADVPYRSQIQAWSTGHLEAAASHWTETAETWEHAFASIHRESLSPGGTAWEGGAAEAAQERTFADLVKVRGLADALYQAGAVARNGASELDFAKRRALEAISEAEAAGFTVGEDLSVTDNFLLGNLRAGQIQEHAAAIAARAGELSALDKEVAGKIATAIVRVDNVQFGDNPVVPHNKEPVIQAVDYAPMPEAPVPDPGVPDNPVGKGGPTGADIGSVINKLPVGDKPWIREVRTPQDLQNLWNWMKQNGTEIPDSYGGSGKGVEFTLPDGTRIGQRFAGESTGQPALDTNVPGKGYVKIHINPRGGVPEIPGAPAASAPKPAVEAPRAPVPTETPPARGGGLTGGFGGAPLPDSALPHLVELPHPGDGEVELPVLGDGKPDVPEA
jgi:hypothetical protein